MTNITVEELIVKLKLQTSGFNKSTKKSKDNLNKQAKAIKKTREQIKNLEAAMKPIKKGFDMSALGVMFFGMAIKRLFTQIMTVGINTFTDVMHSVEGTVTIFDRLKTSIEIIKFELGNAISSVIEPFLPLIIDIASKVSDWIRDNDKLAGSLVIVGGVIGSLLFLIGTLDLGIKAVIGFFSGISIIVTGVIAGILVNLWLVIDFFKTHWDSIKTYFTNTFDGIDTFIKNFIEDIKKPFDKFVSFVKNIFSGDLEGAFEDLTTLFGDIKTSILDIWIDFSLMLVNSFRNAWNLIISMSADHAAKVMNIFKSIFAAVGLDSMVSKINNQISKLRTMEKDFTFELATRDNITENIGFSEQQTPGNNVVINVINPSGAELISEIERRITGSTVNY